MPVIYMAVNTCNGFIYIGKTSRSLNIRISQHMRTNSNTYFSRALHTYGFSAFEWDILEEPSESEVNNAERFWIGYFRSINACMYNLTAGGEGFSKKHTSETIQKMRQVHKGKIHSAEALKKQAAKKSKTYILRDKDNNLCTITNLSQFCKTHNIDQRNMNRVVNGKKKSAYGYRLP